MKVQSGLKSEGQGLAAGLDRAQAGRPAGLAFRPGSRPVARQRSMDVKTIRTIEELQSNWESGRRR